MPLFDTSALLPLFDPGHPHHQRAKDAFERAETAVLHPSVIVEFTTVMRRLAKDIGENGNEAARSALKALLDQPRVLVSADIDHRRACSLYLDEPAISFTDAVVARSDEAFDKEEPVAFDDGIWNVRRRAG